MKFWRSFSKKAVLRQFFFVLALFAFLIPVAVLDSNSQVKVKFNTDSVFIKADNYNLTVPYDIIEMAELRELAQPGEKVQDGYDNDIIRTGCWKNEVWGEYYIVADRDTTNCVVLHLNDGRIFVFSRKDDAATAKDYDTLMTYLN